MTGGASETATCQLRQGRLAAPPKEHGSSDGYDPRSKEAQVTHQWKFYLWDLITRLWQDAIGVCYFWFAIVFGLWVTNIIFQRTSTSLVVQAAAPINFFLAFGMAASWVLVVYCGPGKPPPQAESTVLPDLLASALRSGRHLPDKPFGPEDGWCSKCDAWKPTFAHHCQYCKTCSMWTQYFIYFCKQKNLYTLYVNLPNRQ